jgi:hypothetical protein
MSPRVTAIVVTAIAVSALALVPATASADSLVTYACSPPIPKTAANCAIWHTAPVTLNWGWPAIYDPVVPADCANRTFTTDTAGTDVQCIVRIGDSGDVQFATATVRLDTTAPVVTVMTAARPPDNDGWWNHPVAFSFAGTDVTSGVASCDTVTYSGPDGDAAKVIGSCTDVAGNTAAGSFPVKYDATPPTVAPGSSDAKVGEIDLNWTTSADVVSSRVLRSPGIGKAPVSEVYSGSNRSFSDSGVTGGETYTYTINASDPAANLASTTMTVKALAAPQASPATKGSARAPRLDWPVVRGADYYNVQLFRNGRKILSAWPRHSRLQLHKQWRYAGKGRSLAPGTYRWYAWPGFGRRSAHRYGKLIMSRRFKVNAAPPAPVTGQAASRG